MKKHFKLYPYGFVFSSSRLRLPNIPKRYKSIEVVNCYKYYYDDSLDSNIYIIDSYFIIIHGHYAHVGLNNSIDNSTLLKYLLDLYVSNEEGFLNTLDFIGGRYVIIVGNQSEVRLYPDASGSRSVYYSINSNLVSSHLYLLADNCSVVSDELIMKVPPLKYNLSLTPFSNLKSLLPNLYLDFLTKKTKRFFPRTENKYTQMSREERFLLVEHLWKQQLDAYSNKYSNLILSLTAGHDSRISLALARDYKDKIHFFTYTPIIEGKPSSYYEKSLALDCHVVQIILEDIPLKHSFLSFEKGKDSLSNEENKVLGRNSLISHGRYLLKYYKDFFPQEDLIHIRANLLEIGRAYLQNTFKDSSLSTIKQLFLQRVKVNKDHTYYQEVVQLFDRKIHDFHYEEVYGYHLLDLYPWENLHGRWFAEVLNETDVAFDTLLPFNMRAIIDISLSFSLEERKSSFMFDELINRNYPVLNFYGKNDKRNLYEQTKEYSLSVQLYFNSINVYNASQVLLETLQVNDNSVYLPINFLSLGDYSEASLIFTKSKGFVNLQLLSSYISMKNKEYLKYEVLVNDYVALWEDISDWNFTSHVRIFNLYRNDVIKIRVSALRSCQFKSWQSASAIKVLSYDEVASNFNSDINITTTSPLSNVTKSFLK